MPYFVYIIRSEKDGTLYKGFTEDPLLRLARHNNGETVSTRHLTPWIMVYLEELPSKTIALRREKALKKYDTARLLRLISSPLNKVNDFFS